MSQNHSRRRFLQGGGTLLALPFLESLLPRAAWGAMAPPTRLVIMKFPMGVMNGTWAPDAAFNLPDQLTSLNPYKSDIIVTTGLNSRFATAEFDGAGDHARSASNFLTAVRINKSNEDLRAAVSIDREIANRMGLATGTKSLVLAAPGCTCGGDSGYSGEYTSNISWLSPNTPASRITDTSEVFKALFPSTQMTPTNDEEKKKRLQKSILDSVIAEASTLKTKMGVSDKAKLDQYLTGVREMEAAIGETLMQNPLACSPGANPGSTGDDFAKFTRTMMDLMILAMSCDRSRIISYFLDYEASGRGGIGGANSGHHDVSHHSANGANPAQYQIISKWYASQFAYFIGKAKEIKPDSTGVSLLDSSMIIFGSNIHDGDAHNHDHLPIILAGKANGAIQTGRMLTTEAPLANLWISAAQKMGVTGVTTFGDSTGPLAGL